MKNNNSPKLTRDAFVKIKEVIDSSGKFLTMNEIQVRSGQHWSSIRQTIENLSVDPDYEVVSVGGLKNPIIRRVRDANNKG